MIREIREKLGMNAMQFAQLLGVHIASVYRWESACCNVVRLDPLQASLLARVWQGLTEKDRAEREEWAESILQGLLVGGTLVGLALLLKELLPGEDLKQRRRSRR